MKTIISWAAAISMVVMAQAAAANDGNKAEKDTHIKAEKIVKQDPKSGDKADDHKGGTHNH